jgi:hypothetical protein
MPTIEEIESRLVPIREVDFKIYSLERTKSFFKGERFYLSELQSKEVSLDEINNIYWQVNNEIFGEYCRNTITQFETFENCLMFIPGILRQQMLISIISELNEIIQNDIQIKNSIYLDSKKLFEKIPNTSFISFRENSIDRIFNFRKQHIETSIKNIQKSFINKNEIFNFPSEYYETQFPEPPCHENDKPAYEPKHEPIAAYEPRNEPPALKKTSRKVTKNEENSILGTHGFCWNKKRDLTRDTVILHTYLRDHEFIHKDTPVNLLKYAFSGEFLLSPLEIRWTKKVKGKDSKGLLFHFIEQLEHLNFIDVIYQNNELFSKLGAIFCDSSGENLENLAVSKSQWLNQRKSEKTPQEIELDRILYTLLYSDSNKSLN